MNPPSTYCHVQQRSKRSYLGEKILLDWTAGTLYTADLVLYARMAERDGLDLSTIQKLSALGSSNLANCSKDMKAMLVQAGVTANITPLSGPLYKHCILPSTVIKLLARSQTQFQMRLAPSRAEVQLFWEGLFSTEMGMEYKALHPHLRNMTTSQLSARFPCRIHQDAGPYTKNLGMDLIQWSSLMGRGTEVETRYGTI